jgi:integrative and conjugative element protein (TIGR02256 family)
MRRAIIYKRVLIQSSVLDVIRAEVRKSPRTETGGALVGFLSEDESVIVTGACGPGPRAELRRYSVLIDGKYADAFCTRAFEESGGRLDYVGDWHRHPGWSLASSRQDLEAMKIIRDSGCCSIPYPITAIYRRKPEKIIAYILTDDRLTRIKVRFG